MENLYWFLMSNLQRLGILRIAGGLLMLAAFALFLQAGNLDTETLALQSETRALPAAAPGNPARGNTDTIPLPQGDHHALAAAADLQNMANEQGLFVERTDYRFERSQTHNAYQINLPLKGSYPDIRAFLDKALSGHPSLALESLHLSREDIQARNIDAQLRFTLYLR